jgi:hypothetical protein
MPAAAPPEAASLFIMDRRQFLAAGVLAVSGLASAACGDSSKSPEALNGKPDIPGPEDQAKLDAAKEAERLVAVQARYDQIRHKTTGMSAGSWDDLLVGKSLERLQASSGVFKVIQQGQHWEWSGGGIRLEFRDEPTGSKFYFQRSVTQRRRETLLTADLGTVVGDDAAVASVRKITGPTQAIGVLQELNSDGRLLVEDVLVDDGDRNTPPLSLRTVFQDASGKYSNVPHDLIVNSGTTFQDKYPVSEVITAFSQGVARVLAA